MLPTARVLWAVGGLSALVFGIWLAIHVSQYSLTDGWILVRDRAVGDRRGHRRAHLGGLQNLADAVARRPERRRW